jgi:transcriptional regulator with XRE-family HTH domain
MALAQPGHLMIRLDPTAYLLRRNAPARAWVEQILAALGMNMTALAKEIGMSQSTLSKALSDHPSRRVSDRMLQLIANYAGRQVPPEIMASAVRGRAPRSRPDAPDRVVIRDPISGAVAPSPEADVPVWAAIANRRDNLFAINPVAMEWARRHRGIAGARSVAALRMPGEFMAPWRRPNELVYVNPSQHAFAGDHALLKLSPKAGGDQVWTLLQLTTTPQLGEAPNGRWHNPPDAAPLSSWWVTQVLRVIEWPELVS